MLIRHSFTVLPQIVKLLMLVGVVLGINVLPAHAIVLNVTLSDVVISTLGGSIISDVTGSFRYNTQTDKILRVDIISDRFVFISSPPHDPSFIFGPGFAFLDISVHLPFPPPPTDGCQFSGIDIYIKSLCLIPTEPVTSPGQNIPLDLGASFAQQASDGYQVLSGSLITSRIPEPSLIAITVFLAYGVFFLVYRKELFIPSAYTE